MEKHNFSSTNERPLNQVCIFDIDEIIYKEGLTFWDKAIIAELYRDILKQLREDVRRKPPTSNEILRDIDYKGSHQEIQQVNLEDIYAISEIKHYDKDGIRYYCCPFCLYESRLNVVNVQRHMKYKHTGEKPYVCPFCPKRFI
ncbi:hypothetical protein Anas_14191 [Armadillidium nasatum]|uniref:C2H2-type domain-containing protein n=1 Tax=Armadillidium nasatum TaxID=96803 RepID=A0A5N5T0I2_9CRUS|nr:hypothetical protein Anas_14191 [Armadillidium nasatum]